MEGGSGAECRKSITKWHLPALAFMKKWGPASRSSLEKWYKTTVRRNNLKGCEWYRIYLPACFHHLSLPDQILAHVFRLCKLIAQGGPWESPFSCPIFGFWCFIWDWQWWKGPYVLWVWSVCPRHGSWSDPCPGRSCAGTWELMLGDEES